MVEVSALIDLRLLIEVEAVAVIEQARTLCGHHCLTGNEKFA
jgi:hypothetical protein